MLGANPECQTLEDALKVWMETFAELDHKLKLFGEKISEVDLMFDGLITSGSPEKIRKDKRREPDDALEMVEALADCLRRLKHE